MVEQENIENNFLRQKEVLGSVTSGFLSSTEEAELCLCLKVYVVNMMLSYILYYYIINEIRYANNVK